MSAPARAVAVRLFQDTRVRTASFALLFLFIGFAEPVGYRRTYPTVADRLAFARSFGVNKALEVFYGAPRDLITVGGYTAWRAGGIGAIFAAAAGLVAGARALRGEEDEGRQELVLAGIVGRGRAFAAALTACTTGLVVLGAAFAAGLLAAHLSVGGSVFLAAATVSVALVFLGVGAVSSQIASTRAGALELGAAAAAGALLLRIVADTRPGLGWLRWLTPLGWAENMQPFTQPRVWVLVLPLAAAVVLGAAAWLGAAQRDVGSGLRGQRDARTRRHALPQQSISLASWCAGIAVFGVVIGLLSTSFTSKSLSPSLLQALHRIGGTSITTPKGAIGLYFLFFVVAIAFFACWTVSSLRHEEASTELETVFAQPVSRVAWLLRRVLLAAVGVAALGLLAGLSSWVGAALAGANVSLASLLEAGANCVPVPLLFLGVASLGFAFLPRFTAGVAYGATVACFVWQLVGATLGFPHSLLGISPFAHVAPVPAEPFRLWSAAVVLAIALGAIAVATWAFRRRDLEAG